MKNILVEKFKEKYNDTVDLSFNIYDTRLIGCKSFDTQDNSISSILYNPITGFYQCWLNDSQLTSNNEKMVSNFLELN